MIASLAKLSVAYLDTLIGTWTRWRRLARQQLLVVERGWFDLAVDPRRYRLPEGLARLVGLLGRTVPRADLTVLLTGDPAVLHARKPEIGEVEVSRQISAWETLLPRTGRRTLRLDTSQLSPADCAQAIADALHQPGSGWRRVPLTPRRLAMRATGPGPALTIYRPHRRLAQLATRL